MAKTYTYDEVQQHRSGDSCWVVLYGNVYDVTKFLPDHPGGSKIILQLAGTDATEEYDPIHPEGTLEESLPAEAKLGPFDASTLPALEKSPAEDGLQEEEEIMSLEECLNLDDIEAVATKKMNRKAWAYYYSAADDLRSKHHNNEVYNNIIMRPRIFVDCTKCDTSTTMLGQKVSVPLYVSPAAMARLGHPDGEAGIARACETYGAMQIISNNASQTPEQIMADAKPGQVFGWQLYVQTDRKKSEDMLARIKKLPHVKFICLTLDAPVPGKREHDERSKNVGSNLGVRSGVQTGSASKTSPDPEEKDFSGGVGKTLFAGTAPDLTWKTTLPWLAKHTDLPIVLKGLQTHEDAYIASLHAPQVKGIILSNHGGRALDTAPPSIHTLLEIRKYCPEVFSKIEVYLDGGVKRGTDIVKALCLGAKGVGIGRAPLYGLGAGGQEGVERVFEILKAETETAMRLLGCEKIEELGPSCVNTRMVERDIYDASAGLEKVAMWVKTCQSGKRQSELVVSRESGQGRGVKSDEIHPLGTVADRLQTPAVLPTSCLHSHRDPPSSSRLSAAHFTADGHSTRLGHDIAHLAGPALRITRGNVSSLTVKRYASPPDYSSTVNSSFGLPSPNLARMGNTT